MYIIGMWYHRLKGLVYIYVFLLILSMLSISPINPVGVQPLKRYSGSSSLDNDSIFPLTQTLIVKQVSPVDAPTAINSHEIDAYPMGVEGYYASLINPDENIFAQIDTEMADILLNPAPVYRHTYDGIYSRDEIASIEGVPPEAITYIETNETAGTTYAEFGAHPYYGINPFAFRRIRFALNLLIDREDVVNTYFLGYADPQYTFLKHNNPMFYEVADVIFSMGFFNDTDPLSIISDVLSSVGAEISGGYWTYYGSAIMVKFVIRNDDYARYQTGLYLVNQLTYLGFNVETLFMGFSDALSLIYFHDPMEFAWHLYTEGWSGGGIDILGRTSIAFFASSYYNMMPGWGVSSYWNYRNRSIDELAAKIVNEEYTNYDEYLDNYREALKLSIEESVRLWLCTRRLQAPYSNDIDNVFIESPSLSIAWLYNTRLPSKTGSDSLTYGLTRIRDGWNPYTINDYRDRYLLALTTFDPIMYPQPYHYTPEGFRGILEEVKIGGVDIPGDALKWDPVSSEWVEIGSGESAYASVRVSLERYIGGKWHDGTEITWADVFASIAYPQDLLYNPDKNTTEYIEYYRRFQSIFKGLRAVYANLTNNTITLYVDNYGFDKNRIAMEAVNLLNNLMLPAHIYAVSDYLAFTSGTYALTYYRSIFDSIPLLDLVNNTIASDAASALDSLDDIDGLNMVNKYANGLLTIDEWHNRVNNAINWYEEHGNLWISQGPRYVSGLIEGSEAVFEPFPDYDSNDTWLEEVVDHTEPIYPRLESICHGVPFPDRVSIYLEFDTYPEHVKYILYDASTHEFIGMGELSGGEYSIDVPITSAVADGEIIIYLVARYDDDMYPTIITGGLYPTPFCSRYTELNISSIPTIVSGSFTITGSAHFLSMIIGKIVEPTTYRDAVIVFVLTEDDEEEEFTLNFSNNDLSGIKDGDYILEIIGVSPVGNITKTYPLTIDRELPIIQINGIRDVMNPLDRITIEVSDLTGFIAEIYIDNMLIYNGSHNDTLHLILTPSELDLSEGPHSISINAVDTPGHTSYKSLNFTIDETPPTITQSTGLYVGSSGIFNFWFYIKDNTMLSSLELYLDGEMIANNSIYGLMTYNYSSSIDLSILGEGEHKLVMKTYDVAGYTSTEEIIVIRDTQSPTVLLQGIKPYEYIDSPRNIVVEINDLTNTYSELSIDDDTLYNGYSKHFTETIDPSMYNDGEHVLTLNIFDEANNSATLEIPFTIDTTPPIIDINPDLNNTSVSGTVEFVIHIIDLSSTETTIDIDGTTIYSSSKDKIKYEIDTTQLSNGQHILAIKSEDRLGHVGSITILLNINNTQTGELALRIAGSIKSTGNIHIKSSNGVITLTTPNTTDGVDLLLDLEWTSGNILLIVKTTTGKTIYEAKYTPENLSTSHISLDPSNKLYMLTIYDEKAKTYTTIPVYIETDTTPPIINLIVVSGTNKVIINWSIYDESGISDARVYLDNKLLSEEPVGLKNIDISPGLHNITIIAKDLFGNSEIIHRTITIIGAETTTYTNTETITENKTIVNVKTETDYTLAGIIGAVSAVAIIMLAYILMAKRG